mgnify:CR=1 FL=1
MSTTTQSYRAKDITVLEGLEPVRKRPAMFIGGVDSRGVHHLLWEILDNAIDEVINGHASTIEVWRAYREERGLFLAAYREASERYRAGEYEVEFPKGSFPPWIRKAA